MAGDRQQARVTIFTLVDGLYEEAVFQQEKYLISQILPNLESTAKQVLQLET